MIKVNKIIEILIDKVADFFPYFFVFYIVSLSVAMLYIPWRTFFNWEAFSASLLFLGIVSLASKRWNSILTFNEIKIKKSSILKFLIIVSILIYFVGHEISFINFIILSFGLVALFFGIGVNFAWLTAMFFLLSIPIFLALKDRESAEIFAIYAYYFLVIMVIGQFRNYLYSNQADVES